MAPGFLIFSYLEHRNAGPKIMTAGVAFTLLISLLIGPLVFLMFPNCFIDEKSVMNFIFIGLLSMFLPAFSILRYRKKLRSYLLTVRKK